MVFLIFRKEALWAYEILKAKLFDYYNSQKLEAEAEAKRIEEEAKQAEKEAKEAEKAAKQAEKDKKEAEREAEKKKREAEDHTNFSFVF